MNARVIINRIVDVFYILRNNIREPRYGYKQNKQGDAVIIGTGPSMSTTLFEISKKNRADFFVVNDFALYSGFKELRPNYYILEDPAYWLPPEETNDDDVAMRNRIFATINDVVDWHMTICIPSYLKRNVKFEDFITNSNVKFAFYNSFSVDYQSSHFYYWCIRHNYTIPKIHNVLGTAIYLAINTGYCSIRVIGAEHSWTKDIRVNNQNEVCTIKRHFYSEEKRLIPWRKANKQVFKMHEILTCLANHFHGYHILREYGEQLGVTIFNCTPDSFIDAFNREDIF